MPSRPPAAYDHLLRDLSGLLEQARRSSARTVNALMTATYWETGRRIVEFEQGGEKRAVYGEALLLKLARDLTARFGRGFGKSNLFLMRKFHLDYEPIFQTASGKLAPRSANSAIFQTVSGISAGRKQAALSLESAGIPQTLSAELAAPKNSEMPSRIPIEFRLDPERHDTEVFLSEISSLPKIPTANPPAGCHHLVRLELQRQLRALRHTVLNPLSHFHPTTVNSVEVQRAINVAKEMVQIASTLPARK